MGQNFFNRFTDEGFRQAIAAYQKAIRLDPRYGDAYAGMALAEAYVFDAYGNPAILKQALEDAEKGIALAPPAAGLTDIAVGSACNGSGTGRARRRTSRRRAPSSPATTMRRRTTPLCWRILGDCRKRLREARKLLNVEPLSVSLLVNLTNYQTAMGDFTGAEATVRRAIEVEPADFTWSPHWQTFSR